MPPVTRRAWTRRTVCPRRTHLAWTPPSVSRAQRTAPIPPVRHHEAIAAWVVYLSVVAVLVLDGVWWWMISP